jgi:hypothetical protein
MRREGEGRRERGRGRKEGKKGRRGGREKGGEGGIAYRTVGVEGVGLILMSSFLFGLLPSTPEFPKIPELEVAGIPFHSDDLLSLDLFFSHGSSLDLIWSWKGREGKGREGKGREGKGREGKGREGKGREGKGREGKGRGEAGGRRREGGGYILQES